MISASVDSSNLSKAGWENGDLLVQFRRGEVYRYTSVPIDVYTELVAAPSVGRYFVANVSKTYPYTKVGEPVPGFS
jgi:hypothetical protein